VVLVGCGGPSGIHKAAANANIVAVKQYLDGGADVNAKNDDGWTPLHGAALKSRKEIAELLIAEGADLNATNKVGGTPLHYAALNGFKEIAELLINKGADLNAKIVSGPIQGSTPLDIATLPDNPNKNPESATLLRKHGGKTAEELKAEGK
jgi:ankyrin repeat protein